MTVDTLSILVRPSTDDDVPAMLAIYRHHIERGVGDLGTFEPEPLREDDLKQRRKNMKKHRLPHLVAERDGVVAAYAYAVPFRKRPAYRFTLKHSIYVHPDYVKAGIGRTLLPALIDACATAGSRQMIGFCDKFGHWVAAVLVQRALGSGDTEAPGPWLEPPAKPLLLPPRNS
jgi:L-amino acid N-acyltransferase YncA